MRILLTRPENDGLAFAEALAAAGIEAMIAPLMTVEMLDGPALDFAGVQALLLTSANGVRALAARSTMRTLPVFAVGDATARTARAAGFSSVESAGGDVGDLAALVRRACDPAAGALLHIAGSRVAGDLAGVLGDAGFSYRREVLYAVQAAETLPRTVLDALGDGSLSGVALFSPRSATTLEACADASGVSGSLDHLTVFALSNNVAEVLIASRWHRIVVASEPTAEALLAGIKALNEVDRPA